MPSPLLSVLLPTRNRLEFLRHATETVVRQDDGDWELVISDNDSEQDIAGYVEAQGDERIRYVRTPSFVPVTDNWNNALEASSGRYVVMLGDDDGLMPGFVSRIRALVERFEHPDLIYQSAWLLALPGVFPDEPGGYAQPYGYSEFLRGANEPFELDQRTARRMVSKAMGLRVRYGFNMQFSTVNRSLVDRLAPQGPFFQSAFPDYYATNVAFLNADRIVVEPEPLVAIGVTPKSYGFFHAAADEEGGRAFLGGAPGGEPERAGPPGRPPIAQMPGTNINTGWLSAVEAVAERYPELVPRRPGVQRFRLLQALFVYEGHYLREDTTAEQLATLESYLSPVERRVGRLAMRVSVAAKRVLPPRLTRGFWATFHHLVIHQFVAWNPPKLRDRYTTMVDLFEAPPPAPAPARASRFQRLRRTAV